MLLFRTPTQPDALVGGGRDSHPLWENYGAYEAGTTVWKYKPDNPNIIALDRISNVVFVATGPPHGLSTGDILTIVCPSNSTFNGTFIITVTGSDTFKYDQIGSDASAGSGFISFWTHSAYPYQGGAEYRTYDDTSFTQTSDTGIATAQEVYMGGSVHPITDSKGVELVAAGFGSGVTTGALSVPASQNTGFAYTDDKPSFKITDIDVRILMAPDVWGAVFISNQFVGQYQGGAPLISWAATAHTNGKPRLAVWPNGVDPGVGPEALEAFAYTPGTKHWHRQTFVANDGLGSSVWNYYTGEDGVNWTNMGGAVSEASQGPPFDVTMPMRIPVGLWWGGRIYYVEVRSGIDGPIIANPDFRTQIAGTRSLVDSVNNHWLLTGIAKIIEEAA